MLKGARGRALHLIDIENLAGCPRPTSADVAACYEAYRPLIRAHDLVVIACNHAAFVDVAWGWPNARRLVRSGDNGADEALLDVLRLERIDQRFENVVVASGDGIFSESVAHLGGLGIAVTVVSRAEALSRRLRMAARHNLYYSPATELAQTAEPA